MPPFNNSKSKTMAYLKAQCFSLVNRVPIGMVVLSIVLGMSGLVAQSGEILFTQSFTNQCKHYDLEFLQPIETVWIPNGIKQDEYSEYALSLSSRQGMEMRVIFNEMNPRFSEAPTVRFSTILSNFATNDHETVTRVSLFTEDQAQRFYNATWAALAEFTPKRGLTNKRKGLLQCIYLPDRVQVFVIVFFDNETIDPAYSRIMRFRTEIVND